jgi:hypothetical protein
MGADLKLSQIDFDISFQDHIRIIIFFFKAVSNCWKSNSQQPMKDCLPIEAKFGRR